MEGKKRKKKVPLDDEFTRKMMEGSGEGISTDFWDNYLWLHDEIDEHSPAWVVALDRYDTFDDPEPLAELLESGHPLPPSALAARHFLADAFRRAKQRTGRPRIPAYQLSSSDLQLWFACRDVREYVRYGKPKTRHGPMEKLSVDQAIAAAAEERGIKTSKVDGAYKGLLGSARRAAKRRRPPKSKPTKGRTRP